MSALESLPSLFGNSYPVTFGKYKGAFDFDGTTGDYIDTGVDYDLSGSGDFTVEAWVKAASNNEVYSICQMHTAGYSSDWIFFYGSGSSLFWMRSQTLNKPTGFDATEWNHLVMVWNITSERFEGFVNGESIGASNTVSGYGGIDTIKIGTRGDASSSFFDGTLDEVAIYTRALSPNEIEDHYNRGVLVLNISSRSCSQSDCSDGVWKEGEINSFLVEPFVPDNRYFQYSVGMESNDLTDSPKLFNTTISYGDADSILPSVTLLSPIDGSGDNNHSITFAYSVDDNSDIDSCELILDGVVYDTDNSITQSISQEFSLIYLVSGVYNWQVNCTDVNGNENASLMREFTVIATDDFDGQTTDLTGMDIENVANFVLENIRFGLINFSEVINLSGVVDIDSYVTISHNNVTIDSSAALPLNKSAQLTLYNLSFENPIILKDGVACSDCNILSYNGNLTFSVSGFSSYSASENSELVIWDDTETMTKYVFEQIHFYANYTNKTSGESINGVNVFCNISFPDIGDTIMIFNASSELYYYNRSFVSEDVNSYTITCNDTDNNFVDLSATDFINIDSLDGPQGVEVSIGKSGRLNYSIESQGVGSEGGNSTYVNLTTNMNTGSWQGYVGNVSNRLMLGDNTSVFYDFGESLENVGEIYAARVANVNFATINCSNSSHVAAENSFIGKNAFDVDNVANTFDKNNHSEFFVGETKILANSCASTNLFVNNQSQDTDFVEVLLTDGVSNMVYTSLINGSKVGFDGNIYDYQMIVGTPNEASTTYYFFLEI